MEVEHFNPNLVAQQRNEYQNLNLASRHCNGAKSDNFTDQDESGGELRLLDPCRENDYGSQIFEDSSTYELVGTTPNARWHIEICDLNADHLIRERRDRAELRDYLSNRSVIILRDRSHDAVQFISGLRRIIDRMIPFIPSATR
jgi:hypothetical protein